MFGHSLQSFHFRISDRSAEPGSSNQCRTAARTKETGHRSETDLPEPGGGITDQSEHGE